MNKIIKYHSVDIEWGNHDIIWMGAAAGSELAICNVVRNSAKYNTLETLEEGYGINILPLARFASNVYKDDPCLSFLPRSYDETDDMESKAFIAKIHKAISIIQFKLEHEVITRNPNFELEDRLLLDKMDLSNGTVLIGDKEYKLNDTNFPTLNSKRPYQLTKDEKNIVLQLKNAFLNNDLLQSHIKYILQAGQMYLKYNNNLLFHGCIPLEKDGSFSTVMVDGLPYKGRQLFDILEQKIRFSFLNRYDKRNIEKDYFIFLWQGKNSPLFGKQAMKTFEGYFIEDKITHYEKNNDYFTLRENKDVIENIYNEFEIDINSSKIINGHVPSDVTAGDNPIKADGLIYAIDGGMSKQYSSKIRIGGYTLVSDSYRLFLISHQRFTTKEDLIDKEQDIISLVQSEEVNNERVYIRNTDIGSRINDEINDLYKLLDAYRSGVIKEAIQKI
jgi:fructose-1,6-bisphosphatase-3